MVHRLNRPLILALLVLSCGFVHAQSTNPDPLKTYTKCKASEGLKIREVDRRASKESFREVKIGAENKKVSVLDGYRVMFAYPDLPYYFANVKIEKSSADSYEEDKQILIDQLKSFTTTKETTAMIFTDKIALNGFEHYGLDRDKIDVGGQVGTHVLFHNPQHLVVTIYFLNQSKAAFFNNRRFETIEEYRKLRDDFLNAYSACLERVAETR